MTESIFEYKEGSLGFDSSKDEINFKITKEEEDLTETFTGIIPRDIDGNLLDIGKCAKEYIKAKITELELAEQEVSAPEYNFNSFTL